MVSSPQSADLAAERRLGGVVLVLSSLLVLGVGVVAVAGRLEQRLLSVEGIMAYAERYRIVNWFRDAAVAESVHRGFLWAQSGGSAEEPISDEPLYNEAQRELHALFAALFPSPWLEGRLRLLLVSAWPFMTGASDSFSLRLAVLPDKARTEQVLAERLPNSTLLAHLYDQLTDQAAARIVALNLNWPLSLDVEHEDLLLMLRDLLPRPWVASRLAQAVGHLTAYLRGDQEHFALLLPVQARDPDNPLAQQVRALLLRADTGTFLLNHFIRPAVRQNLENGLLRLPWALSLAEEDVVQAYIQVLPEDWLTAHKINISERVAMFLLGEREDLRIEVNFADRKPDAAAILSRLLLAKLYAHLPALPVCLDEPTFKAQFDRTDQPIGCRLPDGWRSRGAMVVLDLHITARLTKALNEKIPDAWSYTDAQLRDHLGPKSWSWVQTTREVLRSGFVLTDQYVREQLSDGQRHYFDRALDITRHGLALDSQALESTCSPDAQPCGWQRLRTYLGLLKQSMEAATAVAGLAAFGLLGWFVALRRAGRRQWLAAAPGRRWAPRILGGLSVLVLAATWWLDQALKLALTAVGRAWAWPQLAPEMPDMFVAMRKETVEPLYMGAASLLVASFLLGLWTRRRSSPPPPATP